MKIKNILKGLTAFIFILALIMVRVSAYIPAIKAYATDLACPENVGWKAGNLATAEWGAVEGADYYILTVSVSVNGVIRGTTETGTSSTETDLQQQIRNLSPEGVDKVDASFCVKAQNTLEGLESEYSDYSDEKTYYLNAFDTLEAPSDVRLSESGVLSFKIAEGTDHFMISCQAEGSGISIGGEAIMDEDNIKDGYYYLDISDGLKSYYISRGHVGETVRFSAQVQTVASDGRYSEGSEQSNSIDFLIESALTTPTFVSLEQEAGHYIYTFENEGVPEYYEFELYLSRYYSRGSQEEVIETAYKPNMQMFMIDPLSYDSFEYLGSGRYKMDILSILRYYLYYDWEPDPDYPVDIGIRVRSVVGDDVSEFSSSYNIENFQAEALMARIQDPVIEKNIDKYTLSFGVTEEALGYDVRFHCYNPGFGAAMMDTFSSDQCTFSDGVCYIDITQFYNKHLRPLAQNEEEMYFCVSVRALKDQWGKYEIGAYSVESNMLEIEPYGAPVESITLSPSNPILAVGNSLYLGKTVTPANGYYENIEWISDNEDVVTVNGEGRISGVGIGSATITAIVDNSVRTEVTINTYEVQSNIDDQEEATFVQSVSGDIIDDIGNSEEPDLSHTDISESDLEDIKNEIHEGIENGDTFHTDIVLIQQTFDTYKNNWGQVQKAAKDLNAQFAGAYNIEVEMYHKDKNDTNHHIGNITEFENEITFTIDLVGNSQKYVLVRVHKNSNGEEEYEALDFVVNEDGTLTVKSDKFSDFILLAVDESSTTGMGDVNNDGVVNAKDVTALRRYLAGGWNVTIDLAKADVNADGSVNAKDVTVIRRFLTGGWGVVL